MDRYGRCDHVFCLLELMVTVFQTGRCFVLRLELHHFLDVCEVILSYSKTYSHIHDTRKLRVMVMRPKIDLKSTILRDFV